MKIYISVLPVTLGIILHIHVSSSMRRTYNQQASLSSKEYIAQSAPLMKLPHGVTTKPILGYDENGNLVNIHYGFRNFPIAQLETTVVEEQYLPIAGTVIRKGHFTPVAKFNGANFGSMHPEQDQQGCCSSKKRKFEIEKNDLIVWNWAPYAWCDDKLVWHKFVYE